MLIWKGLASCKIFVTPYPIVVEQPCIWWSSLKSHVSWKFLPAPFFTLLISGHPAAFL